LILAASIAVSKCIASWPQAKAPTYLPGESNQPESFMTFCIAPEAIIFHLFFIFPS
jgi:hypothetical protein